MACQCESPDSKLPGLRQKESQVAIQGVFCSEWDVDVSPVIGFLVVVVSS